ncbi:MAG: TfoX/Sxy family protein [Planctomycetaceae bacterium]
MAYNETLADRVRTRLNKQKGFSEKKMFGGICFLLNGNMCCGVTGDDLMLRLGQEAAAVALNEPHTREMDFTGRPLKSMIFVDSAGYEADDDLANWVQRAVNFCRSLPPKSK